VSVSSGPGSHARLSGGVSHGMLREEPPLLTRFECTRR
jgi:hypothetical protein